VEYPERLPSRRNILSLAIPAVFAAALAISIEAGAVIKNWACAILSAYVISSIVYAGEAPDTLAPYRE
jgi:NhaP-type Na+/H+ or K+/H+ antiporter